MKINSTHNSELRENKVQSDLLNSRMDKFFTIIQHWDHQISELKIILDKRPGEAEQFANRILAVQVHREKVMDQHRKAAFELDENFGRYLNILDYMAITPKTVKQMLDAKYGKTKKGTRVREYKVKEEVMIID